MWRKASEISLDLLILSQNPKKSYGFCKTWESFCDTCEKRGEGDLNPRSLSGTGLAIQRLTGLGHPRIARAYEGDEDKGFRTVRSLRHAKC
jgi:hypothetical protein